MTREARDVAAMALGVLTGAVAYEVVTRAVRPASAWRAPRTPTPRTAPRPTPAATPSLHAGSWLGHRTEGRAPDTTAVRAAVITAISGVVAAVIMRRP